MGIAYTQAKINTNWSDPTMWTPNGVPTAADTVTLNQNGWCTVDQNFTIAGLTFAGTSPPGLYLGNNVLLQIQGNLMLNAAGSFIRGIKGRAGSILEFDGSVSGVACQIIPQQNGMGCCSISIDTANPPTAANPFIIRSNAGGPNAYFATAFTYYGYLNLQYTKFLRMGDASHPMWAVGFNGATYTVNCTNCTFDTCGPIDVVTTNPTVGQCNFTDCAWVNSLNSYNTKLLLNANYTRCVFDKEQGLNVGQDNCTYTNCFFGNDISNGGQTNKQGDFTDNLVVTRGGDRQITGSNVANSLFIDDSTDANPHMMLNGKLPQVFNGLVFEFTNQSASGSGVVMVTPPTTAGTAYEIKNCLAVPSACEMNSSDIMSMQGAFNNGGTVNIHNNTACLMGKVVTYNETGNNAAGQVSLLANNIGWTPLSFSPANASFVIDAGHTTSGPSPVDIVSPANCKTNNLFGNYIPEWDGTHSGGDNRPWYTNQGNGYGAAYSSTPGTTDLHVDPQFKDATRNLATFDSAYLHHVAASTWASHAGTDSFAVGDIVSNNNALFYNGIVVNFRCIQAHTKSTAGTEPGGSYSSSWRSYWELASYNSIRNAVTGGVNGAAQTITDPSLGLSGADYISAAIAWIRDGFAPTNQSLKAAGYDGTDIGAIAVQQLSGFTLPFPNLMALSTFTHSASTKVSVALASANVALPGSGTAAVVLTNLGSSPVWVLLGTSNAVSVSPGNGLPIMPGQSFPLSQGANTYIAFCSSGAAGSILNIATGS